MNKAQDCKSITIDVIGNRRGSIKNNIEMFLFEVKFKQDIQVPLLWSLQGNCGVSLIYELSIHFIYGEFFEWETAGVFIFELT